MKVTTQLYGQFLINSTYNYTGTYFSDIVAGLEHDSVWRHLNGSKLPSRAIWERVKQDIVYSKHGYLLFDDSVHDKSWSKNIALARWQYSGTTHETVMGIGVVNCVYYNPDIDRYWVIDSRIYQPNQDGKKKYDHLKDMLLNAISRGVLFRTVLMDTWYAITHIMHWINAIGYKFVCPIRNNRQVLDLWSDATNPKYRSVKDLPWDHMNIQQGVEAKLKACSLKLKLFRITAHSNRTDYIITNDEAIGTTEDATKACKFRWKIEQYHREVKQVTGIGKCQCRNAKAQRKHIITSIIAWIVMNAHALAKNRTIYAIKNEPLKIFQEKLWRNPYTAFN
ncbi:IS701 family transposase [Cardinium endosymbiont of Culicoides punctatus]|uniref:IS701 family transposase n=1 Tax=Cardinium endosymbiont of Culicoides punctatus TaxID=2304601 RepID=UPI001058A2B8|nr:transposase [Cardinium endosymbiont of Culicoides punctatus]TDG93861.1 hypothetical protein CCPUN_08560 [Cardinium endosymbiont of Culicoides punctatus]